MEISKEHICLCLLYEYMLGHSASAATRNICRAFGPGSIGKTTATDRFNRFRNGNFSLQDEARPGRPTTIDLDELRSLLETDPTLTTTAVATTLGCNQSTVHYHLRKLEYVSKQSRWSPHDPTPSQLKKRVAYCEKLLKLHRNQWWLDNLITGDEKWVLYTNTVRKKQWVCRGQATRPTPKAELHPKKRMFCVWWGVKGVIYWELLPEKNRVTGTVYRAQISRLKEQVDIVGPRGPKVYFQHDNARPHASETVRQKLDSLGWTVIPHPPFSPDLAPSDYHIFHSLSNHLRGKNYRDEEELKSFSSVFWF